MFHVKSLALDQSPARGSRLTSWKSILEIANSPRGTPAGLMCRVIDSCICSIDNKPYYWGLAFPFGSFSFPLRSSFPTVVHLRAGYFYAHLTFCTTNMSAALHIFYFRAYIPLNPVCWLFFSFFADLRPPGHPGVLHSPNMPFPCWPLHLPPASGNKWPRGPSLVMIKGASLTPGANWPPGALILVMS